jgi:hypothetical protein
VIAIAYAARHPERVSRLVLYSPYLRGAYAGVAEKYAKQAHALAQMIEVGWGREAGAFREIFANLLMPDGGKEQLKWIGELQRRSASPEMASRLWNAFHAFDIRAEVGKVTTPTLVFHVRDDAMVPFEADRQVAAAIPNARFVPLESKNHMLLPQEKAWAITFGVMFTPDQDKAAAELIRVCKRGGKIGLANWTPEGFVGQLFKTLGKHVPPPTGVKSPALWGTHATLDELFGKHGGVRAEPRIFVLRYRTTQHWLDVFRTYYGPMFKAFGALDAGRQDALAADMIALVGQFNRASDGSMAVPSEYLEVVVTKR